MLFGKELLRYGLILDSRSLIGLIIARLLKQIDLFVCFIECFVVVGC